MPATFSGGSSAARCLLYGVSVIASLLAVEEERGGVPREVVREVARTESPKAEWSRLSVQERLQLRDLLIKVGVAPAPAPEPEVPGP